MQAGFAEVLELCITANCSKHSILVALSGGQAMPV
jgi:hypothetical protein